MIWPFYFDWSARKLVCITRLLYIYYRREYVDIRKMSSSFSMVFLLKVRMNIKGLYIHTCAHIQIYIFGCKKSGVDFQTTSLVTTLLTHSYNELENCAQIERTKFHMELLADLPWSVYMESCIVYSPNDQCLMCFFSLIFMQSKIC